MLYALTNAVVVVDLQKTYSGEIWSHVNEHQWNLAPGKLLKQVSFDTEGHDGHAIHIAFEHPAEALRHARRVVVCRAYQYLIAMLNCNIFKSLDQFRKERIRYLRDDEAEYAATSRHERSRSEEHTSELQSPM